MNFCPKSLAVRSNALGFSLSCSFSLEALGSVWELRENPWDPQTPLFFLSLSSLSDFLDSLECFNKVWGFDPFPELPVFVQRLKGF